MGQLRAITGAEALAAELNARAGHGTAEDILRAGLHSAGRVALVSSFGAEAVVLLHLASRIDPGLPVLFIDTEMLFPETLAYQRQVAERLGLSCVRILRAGRPDRQDPDGMLHRHDPDACCALRKTGPLQAALAGFDGWITGRKRYQAGTRAALEPFEAETGTARIKINPLARWTADDIAAHIDRHDLPRHPLVARGYPSIGCVPCTRPVSPGEDARAGRWAGRAKVECGIHFSGGRAARTEVSA